MCAAQILNGLVVILFVIPFIKKKKKFLLGSGEYESSSKKVG